MAQEDGERKNGGSYQAEGSVESGHRRRAELVGGKSIARVPVIGLTGGIASGKSTVARFFKSWGACVISGDELGWRVLQDRTVQKKLVALFGSGIFTKGQIDRKVIGPKVFANKKTLTRFNCIVHPSLLTLLKKEVAKAHKKKCKAIVIDAALLAEWRIPIKLDFLLMVHASKSIQLKRLMAKGLSRGQALCRIRSQMPYRQRRRISDRVFVNSGSLEELRRKTKIVWQKVVSGGNP